MLEASKYDTQDLLAEWHWLVPPSDTPFFVSALGDWVFGNPNGSLWVRAHSDDLSPIISKEWQ